MGQREWEALFPRFARYYEQLTLLPRRTRRSLQRRWRRSLAAIALLLALGQAPAFAATINVTGTCTLVRAITAANTDTATGGCTAGSGADTLVLQNSSVHTLTSFLPEITSAMTIEGNGSTIRRNPADPDLFRIFAVNGTGDLTLNETTVSGGVASAAGSALVGGGISNYGGTLTLTNSTVSGNTASGLGGGVYNGYGNLTLTHSTVSGNSANRAGGVYSIGGTATLTNSTVSDNSADYSGGGAVNFNGTLTLTDSTVSGNTADGGGGVYNHRGTLAIENSSVSGNSASFRGGGVFNGYLGTLTLTNSTVSGNTADGGGGVANDGDTLVVTNSTVVGNTNSGVFNLRRMLITNSTVSYNTTDFIGGGVDNSFGTLVIENSTVSGNSAAYRGGGVSNFYTLTITNSTVAGNTAGDRGGGVYNSLLSTLTLARSLISGNTGPNGSEAYNNTPYGTVHADSFNLFGTDGDAGIVGFTPGATDIVPTAGMTLTDILAPLADNGGPTQTHALIAGSPAIDAVGRRCPPPATDQRGVPRPQGAACDIGSFEIMAAPAPDLAVSKTDSPDPVLVSDHLRYTMTVNNAGQGEATGVILTDTLPASVDFVSVRPRDVCGELGGVVTCEHSRAARRPA